MTRTRRSRPARRARLRWRRYADLALALFVLGALALAVEYGLNRRETAAFNGAARVADGDSLVVGGRRVRLQGMDAPELAQECEKAGVAYPCGREARDALARLVAGRAVECASHGRDRYDRVLATCTAGGVDLNLAMVEAGWAVSYGDYRHAEHAARQEGRGLWAGSFERPQDWRRDHGGLAEESHDWLSPLIGWLRRLFGA